MKKIFLFLFIVVFFNACSTLPTVTEGKQVAESIIKEVDKGNYTVLASYFNNGEPEAERIEKYKQLKDALGNVQEIHLIDSAEVSEEEIILKFLVKHSKMNSIETFIIVKDEGKCKAASHLIRNE